MRRRRSAARRRPMLFLSQVRQLRQIKTFVIHNAFRLLRLCLLVNKSSRDSVLLQSSKRYSRRKKRRNCTEKKLTLHFVSSQFVVENQSNQRVELTFHQVIVITRSIDRSIDITKRTIAATSLPRDSAADAQLNKITQSNNRHDFD